MTDAVTDAAPAAPCDCRLPRYAAETGRLRELRKFLAGFAPPIGGQLVEMGRGEVDAGPKVEAARDAAIVACFAAVEEIAATTAPADEGE